MKAFHISFFAIVVSSLALLGCGATPATTTNETLPVEESTFELRPFMPMHDGEKIIDGISYGPYREGQRPGGPNPTSDQIREDLQIIAKNWDMIRVYSSRHPTDEILRIIREEEIPLVVVLGAWIAPDDPEANRAEVDAAIRLANEFKDEVVAVSVGNETQVFWSGHRSEPELLIRHIREVRDAVAQPVTTADDYNFWNKPESHTVADEVDFILLHAYAMWNQQSLENAVPWTAETVESIVDEHPDRKVVLAETGWATGMNPEGSEAQYIKAEAGEAQQAQFFAEFTEWARTEGRSYFYFEAFDEPWKGSDDPREVEKHWGLYRVDRTPKQAMKPRADEASPESKVGQE